jgi:hypothetical protein
MVRSSNAEPNNAGLSLPTGSAMLSDSGGLFVPKPSRGADCQRRNMPDLGQAIRGCLLASTAVGGDCYSLGYPALRCPSLESPVVDELDPQIICSCGLALRLAVTWVFGSRQFSPLHVIFGAHVPCRDKNAPR